MSELDNIAIRTCDRPAHLQRLLASLSKRNVTTPTRVLIFDDSRSSGTQHRNREIVASAHRRFDFDVYHLGESWQQDFARVLHRKFPDETDSLNWLLGKRPKGRFSGGRLFNLIMLALAGHRFTLFDDDYRLDCARHLGNGDNREMEWAYDPERQVSAHLSVRAARAIGQKLQEDPVQLHLKYLGKSLGDCLRPGPDGTALLDGTHSGRPPERLNVNYNSKLLTTGNGEYGVPISPNLFYLIYQDYVRGDPPWLDYDNYRVLRQGRAVWNLTFRPTIMSRIGATPSGIDNRALMPPTLPDSMGEDTLFCLLIKFLHPTAAHLDFPWALEHSRAPVKWSKATFSQVPEIQIARSLTKHLKQISADVPSESSASSRLQFLSQQWLSWSNQSRHMIFEGLHMQYLRTVNWRVRNIGECLKKIPEGDSQVRRDLILCLESSQAAANWDHQLPSLRDRPAMKNDDEKIDWMIKETSNFGQALRVWEQLWLFARDHQALKAY